MAVATTTARLDESPSHRMRLRFAWDQRDRVLLRELAKARSRCDGTGERHARALIGELLVRYHEYIRIVAVRRLHTINPQATDLDDIVAGVLERLLKALHRRHDLHIGTIPFRAVVEKNTSWELIEFWRLYKDMTTYEQSIDHDAVPEIPAAEVALPAEQAEIVTGIVSDLGERQRRIVIERVLIGLKPEQVAARHGLSRGAVDTACSRALARLRRNDRVTAVRNRGGTAG